MHGGVRLSAPMQFPMDFSLEVATYVRIEMELMHLPERVGSAIACGLLLSGLAAAQSATIVTLDQAVDLALAHNHQLQAQRSLVLQSQAQEITANLRPNPTFGFDSQFIPDLQPAVFLRRQPRSGTAVRRGHRLSF